MASLASTAADPAPGNDRLEVHVRCVVGDEKTAVSISLRDGSTVALNRSSDEDMSSTLRRLSLTVQKRRRAAESKAGTAGGGKGKGGKKRLKSENDAGVSAGLFDKETGEPIEIDGVLNRDGWARLCGGERKSPDANSSGDRKAGDNGDSPADSHENNSSGRHGPTVIRIGPASVAADADADSAETPSAPPAADTAAANASSSAAGGVKEGEGVLEMDVVVNPPAVTSLECAVGLPMAGFSIVAQAEAEFETGLDWEWLREEEEQKQESGAAAAAAAVAKKGPSKKGQKKMGQPSGSSRRFTHVVGTRRAYTPTDEDVGRRLMIRCTPRATGRRGRPVVRVLTTPVRPGCEPGPLALRAGWLEGRRTMEHGDERVVSGNGGKRTRRLRVMCYNILADMYCTSEQADKVLYPHCPREFRQMDYRMQMVAREIRGHAADLIMLQECEAKAYDRFLAPGLEFDGLKGIYLNKAGQAQEGEAIFYRSSALTLEGRHDFVMRDAIPALEEFRDLLEAFPHLSAIVQERLTTVAQIAVFRPTSPGVGGGTGPHQGGQEKEEVEGSSVRLIVANTHLYFHPNAQHIRLMQLVALVERISRVRKDVIARGLRPAVVLGGDLNSPPFGPVRYLMGEVIGPDSDLWDNVSTFKWGDRFFDEIAAVPEVSAAAAAAAPSTGNKDSPPPSPGGNERTSVAVDAKSGVEGKDDVDDGAAGASGEPTTAAVTPSDVIKTRSFIPGVPYLRVPLGLVLASGTPPFTNFTPEFTETLDYVFVDGGRGVHPTGGSGGMPAGVTEDVVLRVEEGTTTAEGAAAVAPMPEEGRLRAMTPGLPSETFPSDHVSLVVDLELFGPAPWRQTVGRGSC